jgi:hypothetical protein
MVSPHFMEQLNSKWCLYNVASSMTVLNLMDKVQGGARIVDTFVKYLTLLPASLNKE